jgi:hypothetical protein
MIRRVDGGCRLTDRVVVRELDLGRHFKEPTAALF